MADATTRQVYNLDIRTMSEWIDRMIQELSRSQSAPIGHVIQYDYDRLVEYLDNIDKHIEFFHNEPLPDVPETHPSVIGIKDISSLPTTENVPINHIIGLLFFLWNEAINSQSARLAATLLPKDYQRLTILSKKIRAYMETIIKPLILDPLDLIESSPSAPMIEKGKVGV